MKRNAPGSPLLLLLLLGTGLVLLADVSVGRAEEPPIDAFLCAAARRSPGSPRPEVKHAVALADELANVPASVRAADRLCKPVGLGGEPPADAATHLVQRTIRATSPVPRVRGVRVDDALGTHELDLARPQTLLAPSLVDSVPPPALDLESQTVNRYRCYRARAARGSAPLAGGTLELTLGSGATETVEVVRPRALCMPVDVADELARNRRWNLACYDVRVRGARPAQRSQHVDDGFGAATLDTTRPRKLCLPARAVHACNGAPELCDRRFDEVAYATTHNAMSNVEDGFVGPNQRFSVSRQLADGIRGLMLDIHYWEDVVTLCHSLCQIGQRPLLATLNDIRTFLERRPSEVVTIIFESYVSAADTAAVFEEAGLLPYVHAQPVGAPWPTLRAMIEANRRLVVFTDRQGGTYPWYHHVWSYAFETHYSFATPADLSCTPNRGSTSNSLFILNHFLTQVFGSPQLASQINFNPLFIDRARSCGEQNAALPNFVTVDFYDIGDGLRVVDELNGL